MLGITETIYEYLLKETETPTNPSKEVTNPSKEVTNPPKEDTNLSKEVTKSEFITQLIKLYMINN